MVARKEKSNDKNKDIYIYILSSTSGYIYIESGDDNGIIQRVRSYCTMR